MAWKTAPLSNTFMLTAIIGFLITAFLIAPKNTTWGFTLLLFFAVMFIAAFISMMHGPIVEEKVPKRTRVKLMPKKKVKKRKTKKRK